MSKTEIYKCDKCKEELDLRKLVKIDVDVRSSFNSFIKFTGTNERYDLCETCAIKLGFHHADPDMPVPTTPKDDLYDAVAAIAAEVVEDLTGAS